MTALDTLCLDAVERALLTERAKWLPDPFIPRASITAPDDRLRELFAPSLREVAELGQYASDEAWADWNTYHRLIVLDGQPRERRTDLWSWRTWLRDRLRAARRSLVFPLSFFSFRLGAES